jgi:thiamine kinase-like enzyme
VKKIEQTEINNMPEMDECGRCAQELFDVLAQIEQCAIDKRNATEKLVQALKRDKRISVKIKTKTFVLQHMDEADVIKVKK